jgi:hypothetical protein
MIAPNLRPDSAWGKAHHYGTTSRTSCDHISAPAFGTSPIRPTAVSRIEPDSAESKYCRQSPLAIKESTVSSCFRTQNLTHLHQVSYFKISRGGRRAWAEK